MFDAMKEIQFGPWKGVCNKVKEIGRKRLLDRTFILVQ